MSRYIDNPHRCQGYTLGDLHKSHVAPRKRQIEKMPAPEVVRAALARPTMSAAEARDVVAKAKERGLL